MKTIELHIKNMVCPRCIWAVEKILASFGALIHTVRLGYADIEIPEHLSMKQIDDEFKQYGFDLINDQESVLVENIKAAVTDYISKLQKGHVSQTLSEFVSQEVGRNSSHLSRVFSKHCGQTMEKYFIKLRIEKVKEMMEYGELNLSQIAMTLGYSSVHYLSNQFKKVMGQTMSDYKRSVPIMRALLDEL